MSDLSADVVVVGGGAIGVSVALELARRGAQVTLLERAGEVAAGCSAGNSGLICPSHATPIANPVALRQGLRWVLQADSPFSLRPRPALLPWLVRFAAACRAAPAELGTRALRALSLASLELFQALAAEGLDIGFERRGVLAIYETEAGLAAGRRGAAESGLRVELLDPGEALTLEPALATGLAGALYHPDEANCDPKRFVHALAGAAAAVGASIRTNMEVRSLRRLNGRIAVQTAELELFPESVVLAAGAWTPALTRPLGIRLPLQAGKGYHLDLEPAATDPRLPVFIEERRVIATPLAGRLRLAGTLELTGLDLSLSAHRVEAIRRAGEHTLREQTGRRVLDRWAGLRPCTPDGLPVIGAVPGLPGLLLATGHAMKGVSLAPITGRLIAELLSGEQPSHDLTPFRPDRFQSFLRATRAPARQGSQLTRRLGIHR